MSWRTYRLDGDLGDWASRWDELNRELYGSHPLYDSRFTSALLRHFGRGNERLAVHGSDEEPDGMLILAPYRKGWYTTFRPGQAQICPVLVKSAAILSRMFDDLGTWVLAMDFLCQDPAYSPLSDAGDLDNSVSMQHAVTMNISLDGQFSSYWSERSRKLRSNMRRYHKRIQSEYTEEEVVRITDPLKITEAVCRYGELESGGWKARAGTAIAVDNRQGQFYINLLEDFARTGQASVYEYVVDGNLIGSRLLIWNDNIVIALKTTYDEAYTKFAPGRILLYRVLENEFDLNQGKSLEFYTNASVDQLSWATGTREIRHFTLYRNPMIRMGHHVLHMGKRALTAARR